MVPAAIEGCHGNGKAAASSGGAIRAQLIPASLSIGSRVAGYQPSAPPALVPLSSAKDHSESGVLKYCMYVLRTSYSVFRMCVRTSHIRACMYVQAAMLECIKLFTWLQNEILFKSRRTFVVQSTRLEAGERKHVLAETLNWTKHGQCTLNYEVFRKSADMEASLTCERACFGRVRSGKSGPNSGPGRCCCGWFSTNTKYGEEIAWVAQLCLWLGASFATGPLTPQPLGR